MDSLVEKLSDYELLNNLIPGAIFTFLCDEFLGVSLMSDDAVVNFCLFFVLGLFCSRIGSLLIEKPYKCLGIVKYAPYNEYLEAEKHDEKIKDLLSVNNLYRTMVGGCVGIVLFKLYIDLEEKCCFFKENRFFVACVVIFLLFTIAYRKQTEYIRKRVEHYVADRGKTEQAEVAE